MWIKVWQRWAHGEYKESCTYHEVEADTDIENVLDFKNQANEWSDKYRGSFYEVIQSPPEKWLKVEIEKLILIEESAIKKSKRYIELLRKM